MNKIVNPHALKYFKNNKKLIACSPLYPPVELFHAMGCLPVTLWGLREIFHSTPFSDQHVQNYACSVARHLTEFMLSEHACLVDGLFMYNACDTLRNLPEIIVSAAETTGRTMYLFQMHIPAIPFNETNSIPFFREEMSALIHQLESALKKTFDPDTFMNSIHLYRTMRVLAKKFETIVAQGRISFQTFSEILMANHWLPVEKQIDHLKQAIDKALPAANTKNKRLWMTGILPPPSSVINVIESSDFTIVGNDIAALKRSYDYTPKSQKDPLIFYTDFYQNHFPCSTLLNTSEKRLETMLANVDHRQVDAVIFVGEKFCEHEYFEFPYIEKIFRSKGIPCLTLDISIDDFDNIGPFKTRIEAFSEMLESNTRESNININIKAPL
ncbi:MAG: 2-hydroxyacyl-CoA dehydratase [Candidatus Magnetomorum sp.]|nr:2-hydroxyacyl-CoA dehydratase [Candidatus Magnetomorum sp.]